MQRPIGVTLLAIGAGLLGVLQIYRMLIFGGILSFDYGIGKTVTFPNPQWGQILWCAIIAAIWFYEAVGFWNLRGYAWGFGNFIALFTVIWGFFSILAAGSSTELESLVWIISIAIYFYLNYPGVREHFVKQEMSRLTPEQRAAMEQLQAANASAAAAMAAPAPAYTTPAPAAPPPAAPPPAAPPPAAPPPAAPPPPPVDEG
jgi:hypothetical protein